MPFWTILFIIGGVIVLVLAGGCGALYYLSKSGKLQRKD